MRVEAGLRERNKLRIREAIKKAGIHLFVARGFEAVSVDDIAAAAGVSRTTFFNYYPSKDAVVTEPAPEVVERLRDLCDARPAGEPLWQSVAAVLLGLVASSEEDLRILKRLREDSPALGDLLHKMNRNLAGGLVAWAVERASPDDATLLVDVLLACGETCLDQWDPREPITATLTRLEGLYERLGPALLPDQPAVKPA